MFARLLAGLVLGLLMYIPRFPDPGFERIPETGPKDDPPTPDQVPPGDDGPPSIEIDPPSLEPPLPDVPPTPPPGYEGDWPPATEVDDGPPAPPDKPSIFDRFRDIGEGIGKLLRDPDIGKRVLLHAEGTKDAEGSAKLVRKHEDAAKEPEES
jgi:hypothetical protein